MENQALVQLVGVCGRWFTGDEVDQTMGPWMLDKGVCFALCPWMWATGRVSEQRRTDQTDSGADVSVAVGGQGLAWGRESRQGDQRWPY